MPDKEEREAFSALQAQWELANARLGEDEISEDEILRLLSDRVLHFLQGDAEPFFQLMYRLDISERKMDAALRSTDPPLALATLIYQRELEKIKSRKNNKPPKAGDADLRW